MSSPSTSVSSSALSRGQGQGRRTRTYGSACKSCQKRKIKCGLQKPTCDNCVRYKQVCRYQSNDKGGRSPAGRPAAATLALERTNEALERRVRELEAEIALANRRQHVSTSSTPASATTRPKRVGIEEADCDLYSGSNSLEERRRYFRLSKHVSEAFERMASSRLRSSNDSAVSPILAADLIKVYFVWWNNLHCYLYAPDFYCSLVVEGPHFSPFLLNMVLSQGSRLLTTSLYTSKSMSSNTIPASEYFLARAKASLVDELDKGNSTVLLQGLLIMAGREASCGHLNQAWLYTGMAIRVLRGLGLDRPPEETRNRFKPGSFHKRELNTRLFWTVYCWDKTLSLTLGKTSTFSIPAGADPEVIVDETDDAAPWDPQQAQLATATLSRSLRVSSEPSAATAVFRQFALLCTIIDDILTARYGHSKERDHLLVANLESRLFNWQQTTQHRGIALTAAEMAVCPPPHKLQLAVLCHCCYILLHRPTVSQHLLGSSPETEEGEEEAAMEKCRAHAAHIHDLIRLRERDIGLENLSYLVCHCLYAAVTINVLDFRSSDKNVSFEAAKHLDFGIMVLEFCSCQSAGIRQAVKTMKSYLAHPLGSASSNGNGSRFQESRQPSVSTRSPPAASAMASHLPRHYFHQQHHYGQQHFPSQSHNAAHFFAQTHPSDMSIDPLLSRQEQQQQQHNGYAMIHATNTPAADTEGSTDLAFSESWIMAQASNFGMLGAQDQDHATTEFSNPLWAAVNQPNGHNTILPDFPDHLSGMQQ